MLMCVEDKEITYKNISAYFTDVISFLNIHVFYQILLVIFANIISFR